LGEGERRFPERFEAELVRETKRGKSETVRIDNVFGNHTRPPGAEAVLPVPRERPAIAQSRCRRNACATQELGAARELKALSAALRRTN
jgi:hypothetical protein